MAIRYYVRVSTEAQRTDRQLVAYDKADIVYVDKWSGATKNRPALQNMLSDLQSGDVVVVKSVDRLSRSARDLLEITDEIVQKGATLQVLDKNIDTSDKMGQFFLTVLGAIAELEREMIRERTLEGVAIAKKAGKYRGRKKGTIKLTKPEDIKRFRMLYSHGLSKRALAKEMGVTRPTVGKWIEVLIERGELKERTEKWVKPKGVYNGHEKGMIKLKDKGEIKRFKLLYSHGLSYGALAKEMKVSRSTIERWIEVLSERGKLKLRDETRMRDG